MTAILVQIILGLSGLLTLLTLFLAVKRSYKWYWISGLSTYIFSFLGSWSIGVYTLSLVFILWGLAFAQSLNLMKKTWHFIVVVTTCLIAWLITIVTIDDYWWFFPFRLLIG